MLWGQTVVQANTMTAAHTAHGHQPKNSAQLAPQAVLEIAQSTAVPESLTGVETVVFLGDSITQVASDPGGYIWFVEQYLQKLYPQRSWQFINAGISGDTSEDLRDRFATDVLAHQPQMVVIYVGVNDVWHRFYDFKESRPVPTGDFPAGVSLFDYREYLSQMITTAQAAGIQVVLLSPTPIREMPVNPENQQLQAYIATGQELAQTHHTVWVNLYDPFMALIATYQQIAGSDAHLLTHDGVHPNRAGNQIIAHALLQAWGISAATLERNPLEVCVGLCNSDF